MSRRDQIKMTDDEVWAFLEEERKLSCATNGRDGFPHVMPLGYVIRGRELWSWSYAKAQRVRNLERDPRATLQVEAGEKYHEFRGVMLKCDVEIVRDLDRVTELAVELFTRHSGPVDDQLRAVIEAQAPKRVGLRFIERARATWDHRKLAAGVY